MSNYELKENTGNIFKNDKKESDKHPDYRGTINVDGKEKEIALWVKDGKKGKFFSARIQDKREKASYENKSFTKDKEDLPF